MIESSGNFTKYAFSEESGKSTVNITLNSENFS